jgi:hypothetical protein
VLVAPEDRAADQALGAEGEEMIEKCPFCGAGLQADLMAVQSGVFIDDEGRVDSWLDSDFDVTYERVFCENDHAL